MGGKLMEDIHNMMREIIVDAMDSDDESIMELKETYSIRDDMRKTEDKDMKDSESIDYNST